MFWSFRVPGSHPLAETRVDDAESGGGVQPQRGHLLDAQLAFDGDFVRVEVLEGVARVALVAHLLPAVVAGHLLVGKSVGNSDVLRNALEGLHVTGKYRDRNMQHTCFRHVAWDPQATCTESTKVVRRIRGFSKRLLGLAWR